MLRRECRQLGNQDFVPTEMETGFRPRRERGEAKLREPRDRRLPELVERELGERWAAP